VGITDIDVGDRIDTATMVTTLDDRNTLLVDFPVPESFVGQVAPGVGVKVKLWENPTAATVGEIVAVDSRIDPASRAFTARAGVDNSSDALRPGMAFEIGVPVSRGDFLAVPDVSVQWGADGAYVWVADDAVARRVEVKLVRRLTDQLLVEGELEEGTEVIAEGVQAVREGLALRVLDPIKPSERFELASPDRPSSSGGAAGG
jgi:RND family efflux transporter MFP subunit